MSENPVTAALLTWANAAANKREREQADAAIELVINDLAGTVVYSRCGEAARQDVAQAAMLTLGKQVQRSARFPVPAEDEACERKNRAYMHDTVRSRFVDATRARQRTHLDCGYIAAVRMGEGEADKALQVAREALTLGRSAELLPDLEWQFQVAAGGSRRALLAQRWPELGPEDRERQAELHKRLVSKALTKAAPLLAPADQDQLERLKSHLRTRPTRTVELHEPDWDEERLEFALAKLRQFGVVERVRKQLSATQQQAGDPACDLEEMVLLKVGRVTVAALLRTEASHPDFARLRNNMQKRHDRTRVRLLATAQKLSRTRESARSLDVMLPPEDLLDIEALIRQLKRRKGPA